MILIAAFFCAAWGLASILVTTLWVIVKLSIRREHAKRPTMLLIMREPPEPEPSSDE